MEAGMISYPHGRYRVEPLSVTIQPKDLIINHGQSIPDALEFDVIIAEELIQSGETVPIEDVEVIKNILLENICRVWRRQNKLETIADIEKN